MNRHVPSFSWIVDVGKKLRHDVVECESSLHEQSDLAVLGENNIFKIQY